MTIPLEKPLVKRDYPGIKNFITCFEVFYPTASATTEGQSLSEPNIWLRPKVKIAPTV